MKLTGNSYSVEQIYNLLDEVKDPEIPTISLIDLGVITKVFFDNEILHVKMTPTFSGCPAMKYMKEEVERTLLKYGIEKYFVEMNYDSPWDSNKITEKGRKSLKEFGLSPPKKYIDVSELDFIQHAECPQCNSNNTELRSSFGPTLCRSFHYCNECKMLFEQFKAV